MRIYAWADLCWRVHVQHGHLVGIVLRAMPHVVAVPALTTVFGGMQLLTHFEVALHLSASVICAVVNLVMQHTALRALIAESVPLCLKLNQILLRVPAVVEKSLAAHDWQPGLYPRVLVRFPALLLGCLAGESLARSTAATL
jgi:hypothetical protein